MRQTSLCKTRHSPFQGEMEGVFGAAVNPPWPPLEGGIATSQAARETC